MAEDFSDLKSLAELAVEYLNLLVDTTKTLADAQKETNKAIIENTKATVDLTKAKLDEKKAVDELKDAKRKLTAVGKAVGSELLKMGDAGIKFASTIGTSATRGVQLEYQNRIALISQIKNLIALDANRIITGEQQRAAQQSLTDAFISTREGFELSAKGTQSFAANLKGGFKSEFQLTTDSLRALVTTGMATEAQFENFRKASGRASLSSGQFANIVNKNTLSFLLYGPKFAKAATDAERLGISLAGVQAAQEGLVTNLDGTIDTVAQLNQLGTHLEFGELIRVAETEGPQALLAYARATVPANLLQSASTRALFKQLGISAEDFLKSGGMQVNAAESIEKQMTEASKKTNNFGATILTVASRTKELLLGAFGSVTLAGYAAASALWAVATSGKGRLGALGRSMGFVSPTDGLGRVAAMYRAAGTVRTLGAMGAGVGGGALLGKTLGGTTTGSTIGSILGTGIGAFFGPAGMMVGGALGGALGGYLTRAEDIVSAGYGSRMLVTPKGAFALNNADDIVAGTNLFPKGALQAGSNNSDLIRKVDNLITALSNATTTITVGGGLQTVPRMQLVGVYSRNEVR